MKVFPSSSEIGAAQLKVLVGVLLFLLCGFVVMTIALRLRPSSDEALAVRFARQSNDIQRLVSIVQGPSEIAIVQRHAKSNGVVLVLNRAGQIIPGSVLGQAASELPRLFGAVDCDYVSQNPPDVTVAFRRNGIEDLYPGGIKVIAFCSVPPTSVVSSIDDFRRKNRGRYGIYQHLAGPWYIKYEEAH